ncbi:MAG: 4-hydroxybenzoate octaprenyltransferase [Deltaproteobacteria bacterium]|nr:4-hydroxybenzoate octaprenyltransferase [Deltaproteobacteria bacterium]
MDFKTFSQLIMIEQTLFALPFAWLGILFADGGTPGTWFWATIALVAARSAGMLFNRVIDKKIDARNPRTKNRLLPRGKVCSEAVWFFAIVSSLALIGSAAMLNPLCFYLSFAAVFLLFTYSYMKRLSSTSHFYLGFVEAAAPVGGYLAVSGQFTLTPLILGCVIMAWIAGLDIIYALQDMDFDRAEKLHSVPARFGKRKALFISALCYFMAMATLALAGAMEGMAVPYWLSVAAVGCLFVYQQVLARRPELKPAIQKIFRANTLISPVLLCGTAFAIFLQ